MTISGEQEEPSQPACREKVSANSDRHDREQEDDQQTRTPVRKVALVSLRALDCPWRTLSVEVEAERAGGRHGRLGDGGATPSQKKRLHRSLPCEADSSMK